MHFLVVVLLSFVGLVLFVASATALMSLLLGAERLPRYARLLYWRREGGVIRLVVSIVWTVGTLLLGLAGLVIAYVYAQQRDVPLGYVPPLLAVAAAAGWFVVLVRAYGRSDARSDRS